MSSNDYGIEAKDHGPTLKEMWPGYALNSAITVINLLLGYDINKKIEIFDSSLNYTQLHCWLWNTEVICLLCKSLFNFVIRYCSQF